MPRWIPNNPKAKKPIMKKSLAKRKSVIVNDDVRAQHYAKWLVQEDNTIDKIDKVLSWIELLAQSMSQQNGSMNKMIEIMINSKPEPAATVDNTQTISEDKTTYTKNVPEVAQEIPYYDWMLELHDTWWVIPSNAVNIGTSKSPEHLKELFEKNYKGKSYQLNNWQKFFIKGFRVQRV